MPFKNTGETEATSCQRPVPPVHHGFHLVGVRTTRGIKHLDGVVELLKQHERGDADLDVEFISTFSTLVSSTF